MAHTALRSKMHLPAGRRGGVDGSVVERSWAYKGLA